MSVAPAPVNTVPGMEIVYAPEPFPSCFTRSLFLAGPTPRDQHSPSWRTEAIKHLAAAGFDRPGDVLFVPEPRGGVFTASYDGQVAWETEGLELADVILAWVPRQLPGMAAFTTNVEFGLWATSNKLVFGAPADAAKVRYLFSTATRLGVPSSTTLDDTIAMALDLVGDGAERTGAERFVPTPIFSTDSFSHWYATLRAAGHELTAAHIEYSRPAGPHPMFLWVLHAEVQVAAEGRVKANEVLVGRPDTAAVVAYRPGSDASSARIVLVREFRTSGAASDGFVHELPGGSSWDAATVRDVARTELAEETGLDLDADRLNAHGARQNLATLVAHRTHLFSVQLTATEIDGLAADVRAHGADVGERCYIEIETLAGITAGRLVDYATLGMITEALSGQTPAPV